MNYLRTVSRGRSNTTNELCPERAPVQEGGVASVEEEKFSRYPVQVHIDPDTCGQGQKPAEVLPTAALPALALVNLERQPGK